MLKLIYLIRHELRCLLYAPSTYLAMVLSLLLMGFFYYVTLITVSAEEQEQLPATLYFSLFWVPVLLIVPMLTMRSFAEERRLGTIETLLTAPIRPAHLVTAKFVAAYGFYLLVWAISFAYPLITSLVVDQPDVTVKLLDAGALTGGFLFIAASGTLFVSIGIFTSSLTRSQLVAGMLSFSILFMLIVGVASIRLLQFNPGHSFIFSDAALTYFQVFEHFEDFSRGIIDSRPFVYYLSSCFAVLGLSVLVVESKR